MKKLFIYILCISFMFSSLLFSVKADNVEGDITVLFTHDLHSHITPFTLDGNSVGGFARIKSIINGVRAKHENTLVLDAGDFSMGTLYQAAFSSAAIEYRMLGFLGYDATIFGNHEFDFGFDTITNMIKTAQATGEYLPPILCANIDTTASGLNDQDLASMNIKKYEIIKKGNYNIAVIGLIGKDAVELSSSSNLVFLDYITAAKNIVTEVENLYSPDMIICLSHGGTGNDVNDDVELAKSIDGIDLIISGHTHSILREPLFINDTTIVSCGEYGQYVGEISFNIDENKVTTTNYSLNKVDNSFPEDEGTNNKIKEFDNVISSYLNKFGYNDADEVLAYSPFEFPEQSSMSDSLAEQQLGNLISDSYIYAIQQAEGDNYVPIDVAVAPNGVIRASIDKGNITVSQAFEISSLGIGADSLAGYPLCSVYLYGYELRNLAEVDASVSGIMSYAQLYCSGLNYSANTNRMFLNRVYDCWLTNTNGKRVEIIDDKLYRVVSGIYSAQMLSTVNSKSFGLLELTPKDENGNKITDFNQHIVLDSSGAEVKEWSALASYLSSFPKNDDGIPTIPQRYSSIEGRKNIYDDFDFTNLFTNWNTITWVVIVLAVIITAIIIFAIICICKKSRKKKRAAIIHSAFNET